MTEEDSARDRKISDIIDLLNEMILIDYLDLYLF